MSYGILTVFFIACIFYYSVRFYLNKYKNFKIPLLPERYHDDLPLTYIQLAMTVVGILVGYTFVMVLEYFLY